MTTSNDTAAEGFNLNRDLPTTARDVAALEWAGRSGRMTFEDYLRFLRSLPSPDPEALRSRRGPAGDTPFEL